MKELAVKNYKTAEGQKINQGGNEFTVKPIVEQADVDQCRVNFVEVEPGNFAYGYHYHETDEEVFYIISGTGIVRTANGDVTVKAGDAITFLQALEVHMSFVTVRIRKSWFILTSIRIIFRRLYISPIRIK